MFSRRPVCRFARPPHSPMSPPHRRSGSIGRNHRSRKRNPPSENRKARSIDPRARSPKGSSAPNLTFTFGHRCGSKVGAPDQAIATPSPANRSSNPGRGGPPAARSEPAVAASEAPPAARRLSPSPCGGPPKPAAAHRASSFGGTGNLLSGRVLICGHAENHSPHPERRATVCLPRAFSLLLPLPSHWRRVTANRRWTNTWRTCRQVI